ncbi:MAG: protein translocase subunit SecD [Actinomycetota bacterium]
MKTGAGRLAASVGFVLALVGVSAFGFLAADLKPALGLDLIGGVSVVLTAPEGTPPDVVDKTLETIRARVDAFGVSEPDITRQGELNIQVQIPGLEEQVGAGGQERLLELIGQTAQLEYREALATILPTDPAYKDTEVTGDGGEREEVVFLESVGDPAEQPAKYRLGPILMTGETLDRAQAVLDPATNGWQVNFELTSQGADLFAEITRDRVGKQIAIILDQRVESAPTVQQEITGGEGQITGSFTETEAKDLALVLRTGALPVELEPSQVTTVSPTLGEESLRTGLLAGIVGLIVLAVYLAYYYRLLGVVAWFGMSIWTVFALALVSALGPVTGFSLTLSGVAGIVVSLGITADSYIVFYERLKDEVRQGKTLRVAVAPAFKSAWRTIVAADIVTISAAVVLFLVAIGSVRGFALTLGFATALDMFVVYFFKRPLVFLIARNRRLAELPGLGLRSGVAAVPEPVQVGGE